MNDDILEQYQSPVKPVELPKDHQFLFRCHPEVACFNACCKNIDIQLTPYDILQLKTHLGITSQEFLAQYTVPFEMDNHGMPGVKLRHVSDTNPSCLFVREEGCSVYETRPTACRYYPVGLLSIRKEGSPTDADSFFMVKEEHCLGHQEPNELSIEQYRIEQGVIEYDDINREWRQVVLKKRSAGPAIGKPSVRSYQLFFLASYNLDSFSHFVQSDGFKETYLLPEETYTQMATDQVMLLKFAFRFLKQVLFGEMSIPLNPEAEIKRQQRVQPNDA